MPASKKKAQLARWNRAIGTVLAATRRDADVKQADLASRLEWHRSTIAKLESGEISVRAADLILICQALQVDPEVVWRRILRW